MSEDQKHDPLPVSGYTAQSDDKVSFVNGNKEIEEMAMRRLDQMKGNPAFDQRMVALAITKTQEAWMWANRAVFQPTRVALPGDDEAKG